MQQARGGRRRAPIVERVHHLRRIGGALVAVCFAVVVSASHAALALCGNGTVDTGEECDDGGRCIGGANAGTRCTAAAECIGMGVCAGGPKIGTACASDTRCVGGACVHCVPQGGDGCAANCTTEHDVPYPLIPDISNVSTAQQIDFAPDRVGIFTSLFSGTCTGGHNLNAACATDGNCPGATCVQARRILTVGKERNGTIPLVIKAGAVRYPDMLLAPCRCIRGVAAKTCGGVLFESDGVTPATDCTPEFTAGESICDTAGQPPCTFVHGEGNSASGEIGCDGLDNADVDIVQDSGGAYGVPGPPRVTLSGHGGPGSASLLSTIFVRKFDGCSDRVPSIFGPDGIFCTADDPLTGPFAIKATSPAVTGTTAAAVQRANGSEYFTVGPVGATGAPFDCASLAQGSAAGAGLVQTFTFVESPVSLDGVVIAQLFAGPPSFTLPTWTPTPTATDTWTPRPTRTPTVATPTPYRTPTPRSTWTPCAPTACAPPVCGNGVVESDEDCDPGGTCIGSPNAGTSCTSRARCPGGTCTVFGGSGCAANCTAEHDVPFTLVTGEGDGLNLRPGTSGLILASDFLSFPEGLYGVCEGGTEDSYSCDDDTPCPHGTCRLPRQTLTIGRERNGKVPVVVKAVSIQYPGIPPSGGAGPCVCVRGIVAKTCGGTLFESDGVTRAMDCTPQFTPGDSVCSAAGKPPCTFVHGAGNSASGEIGCDGLDGINISSEQDAAGPIAGPVVVSRSGRGGPGSAVLYQSIGIVGALGACEGNDPGTYGDDGVYCTADDPPGGVIEVEGTLPAVTGTAQVVVHNANGHAGKDLSLVSTAGAPFSCSSLARGRAGEAGLVQALPFVHLETIGDMAITAQFFAAPVPAACVGDCNDRGEVTISEIITMVNIALGRAQPSACPRGLPEGQTVDVASLVRAVNSALNGCGS